MTPLTDLTGAIFGRLTALTVTSGTGTKSLWQCQCQCGATKEILANSLTRGRSRSCGCLRAEKISARNLDTATHGESSHQAKKRTPEYVAWNAMKQRCLNPKWRQFELYGGRGITVCGRWLASYENFLSDMGRRPSPDHSIDRWPDNDGNYEPGNCRWATITEQNQNRSRK